MKAECEDIGNGIECIDDVIERYEGNDDYHLCVIDYKIEELRERINRMVDRIKLDGNSLFIEPKLTLGEIPERENVLDISITYECDDGGEDGKDGLFCCRGGLKKEMDKAFYYHEIGKHEEAFKIYFEIGIEGRSACACFNSGNCLMFGVGAEKDLRGGLDMWKRGMKLVDEG